MEESSESSSSAGIPVKGMQMSVIDARVKAKGKLDPKSLESVVYL